VELEHCKIPHSFETAENSQKKTKTKLHTFCDASATGIAAVTDVRTIQSDGQVLVLFVFGKAKLAPNHATTIPRLELCAAVLAVEITQVVVKERAIKPDSITYYSDSRVVLGYISNEVRRFYVYVSNRFEQIRKYSTLDQCRYVPTHQNPANLNKLTNFPKIGYKENIKQSCIDDQEELSTRQLQPDNPEVRPNLKTLATALARTTLLGTSRFTRFSKWISVVIGISKLITFASKFHRRRNDQESNTKEQQPQPTGTTNYTTIEGVGKQRP
jgi:ribonuclease HI